jgi:formyl-CoA transferase
MSALFHRERTGAGQFIDIALLDSIMPLMAWVVANLMIGKQQPIPMGNDNFTAAPSGTFITLDGHINIAANKQEQWEALTEELGVPELKTDLRFQERDTRKKNRRALTPLLEAKLREKSTAHWVDVLNRRGIPSGAILQLEQAFNQEQVDHRGTVQSLDLEGIGEVKLLNLSAKFEKTPGTVESPPPRLSQHSDEILSRLGYSEAEITRLRESGTI